jgi:hypothetical protein
MTNTQAEHSSGLPAPCVLAEAVSAGHGPPHCAAALEARPSCEERLQAQLMRGLLTQALTKGAAQQPAAVATAAQVALITSCLYDTRTNTAAVC